MQYSFKAENNVSAIRYLQNNQMRLFHTFHMNVFWGQDQPGEDSIKNEWIFLEIINVKL